MLHNFGILINKQTMHSCLSKVKPLTTDRSWLSTYLLVDLDIVRHIFVLPNLHPTCTTPVIQQYLIVLCRKRLLKNCGTCSHMAVHGFFQKLLASQLGERGMCLLSQVPHTPCHSLPLCLAHLFGEIRYHSLLKFHNSPAS